MSRTRNSVLPAGESNYVVILGVTLSLSIIFAIAGVFIGLYFHVERACCCCCCYDDTTPDDNMTTATATTDPGTMRDTGHDNPNMYNVSEEIQVGGRNAAKKKNRKKFFFSNLPRGHKGNSENRSLVLDTIPTAFGATSTSVSSDGQIVRKSDDAAAASGAGGAGVVAAVSATNFGVNFVSFNDRGTHDYHGYGDAAMDGQEDILY